jgi:polyvinyl alcohol dehydrogenase (cytochrome)
VAPPADRADRIGSAAAVSLIPGVAFSGGWDGVLRAFRTSDGQQIWSYDTARAFDTVNGVPGKGGSMGAPGVTVAGGMLFVGSGYVGISNGMPGNVILAFAAQR